MAISSAPRTSQYYSTRSHSSYGGYRHLYCGPNGEEPSWSDHMLPYLSFLITFATVIYGSIGVSEPENCEDFELPDYPPTPEKPPTLTSAAGHPIDDAGGQMVIRNEKKSLVYSYSLFHLMITLACLLMTMHVTSWHTPTAPSSSLVTFGRSWSSAWIKIGSSWLCLVLFFISVLCPSVLPRLKDNRPVGPVIIEVNGHIRDSDSEASFIEEAAVPLTLSKKPTIITMHQETTV